MYLVRLIIQLLKRLRVKHTYEEVQAVVVAVGDNTEYSLLAFAKH